MKNTKKLLASLVAMLTLVFVFAAFAPAGASAQTCDNPTNKTISGHVLDSLGNTPPSRAYVKIYTFDDDLGYETQEGAVFTDKHGNFTYVVTGAKACASFTAVPLAELGNWTPNPGSLSGNIGYSTPFSGNVHQNAVYFSWY